MRFDNSTEFPYQLTIHAAWMLVNGIEDYVARAGRSFAEKLEDRDYVFLQFSTAKKEAERLLAWMETIDPNYLASSITELRALSTGLVRQLDRLKSPPASSYGA